MFRMSVISPNATYQLTPSVTAVDEGAQVTVSLTTTGVQAGQAVPFVVSGTNITTADFDGLGSLSGNFVVDNNHASTTFTMSNDMLVEGLETFTVSAAGASVSVDVNDTSGVLSLSYISEVTQNTAYRTNDSTNWKLDYKFYLYTNRTANTIRIGSTVVATGAGGPPVGTVGHGKLQQWSGTDWINVVGGYIGESTIVGYTTYNKFIDITFPGPGQYRLVTDNMVYAMYFTFGQTGYISATSCRTLDPDVSVSGTTALNASSIVDFTQYPSYPGLSLDGSPRTTDIFTMSGNGSVFATGVMTASTSAYSFNGATFTIQFTVPAGASNPSMYVVAENSYVQTNIQLKRNGVQQQAIPVSVGNTTTIISLIAGSTYQITATVNTTLNGDWIRVNKLGVAWM